MSNERLLDKRWVQIALGVLLIVIALVNTVRLETYIHRTEPRDRAQEQCSDATLKALKLRNDAISLYLKNEDDTPAIKQALVDRIAAIGWPDCDFGGR